MKNICWLDVVIILPLLFGLIRGLMRGLIAELNAVLAVLLGVIGTRMWGPDFAGWIQNAFGWNSTVCTILAYVILFFAIAIIINLIGQALQKLMKAIKMGWINRLVGGICGTIKWAVIVLVIVFIIGQLDLLFNIMPDDVKNNSVLYPTALKTANHAWLEVKTLS